MGEIILITKGLGALLLQAANLAGFRASEDPRFEAGIPDFMNGILNSSIHFNVVHRKVDWRNPKMKSLNSMPASVLTNITNFLKSLRISPLHCTILVLQASWDYDCRHGDSYMQ